MSWFKEVVTDIIVTAAILLGVYVENEIFTGIIFGYSIIMLLAKGTVYFGDFQLQMLQKVQNNAPEWFSHLLYAINVMILLIFKWWITGVIWMLIWFISWRTQQVLDTRK